MREIRAPGTLIGGKYRIVRPIGQGGMSEVYLAVDVQTGRERAVKEVCREGGPGFGTARDGQTAETEILQKLQHANLPAVVEVIDRPDAVIIVMEYIRGRTLDSLLKERGALPQEQVLDWAGQLCGVLGWLHSRRPPVIYRDVKPANIMLQPDGCVMLIDFGAAREYKEGKPGDTACLGTAGYAAPEQFGGFGQTDARTDIYNLGATLYHLVTGKNPAKPPCEMRPIREINPGLSAGLEQVILKCTRPDPAARYSSMEEVADALARIEAFDAAQRRRRRILHALFPAVGVLAAMLAAAAAGAHVNRMNTSYDAQIRRAASAEDYCRAIAADPARTEAYLGSADGAGLIAFLTADGVLDRTDHAVFEQLKCGVDVAGRFGVSVTVDVLGRLAADNAQGYADVCFAIGEAYLSCFDVGVERDRYAAAAAWFRHAKSRYPAAEQYCETAARLQNTSEEAKEGDEQDR